jgi:AcrR family transcriptional regulator
MSKPYHHGDLAPALLRAAEDILEQEGPQALTLRAVARRTGVSHMAPAHHFGDLTGLLSELAAHGYRLFSARLLEAQEAPGARTVSRAMGQAYVRFAQEKPGLFLLMFRSERLDFSRPALAEAARGASLALMRSSDAETADASHWTGVEGRVALARMVFDWSVVHGFAMLLIDGRLEAVMAVPGCERDVATLLDDAIDAAFRG